MKTSEDSKPKQVEVNKAGKISFEAIFKAFPGIDMD